MPLFHLPHFGIASSLLNCCPGIYQFAHLAIQFLDIEVKSIREINCL